MAMKEWECPECGLIFRSSHRPDECPACGELLGDIAGYDLLEEDEEEWLEEEDLLEDEELLECDSLEELEDDEDLDEGEEI